MRVLVTGATSLLGRHTVDGLLTAGHEVVALQRSPSGLPDVTEHLGSITDRTVVERAMDGVDGVVHLAAKVDPVGDWADFASINLDGTAIVHATVEELWYVVSGQGEMWRKLGEREETVVLEPGVGIYGTGQPPQESQITLVDLDDALVAHLFDVQVGL